IPVSYREPDLVVRDLMVPAQPARAGDAMAVAWTVTNQGTRATRERYWVDRVYLSRDSSLDRDDLLLGEAENFSSLGIGNSYTRTSNVTLPTGIEGPYYLLA